MILLLLLLCIGAAVLISQLLVRRFGFRHLTYSLKFSEEEVAEGDTVTLIETICSRKPLPLPWVKAELTTAAALEFASEQSSVAEDARFVSSYFSLFPYRKIERRWRVTCKRRGIFTVSHAILVLSDLFGTMELSQPFPEAEATITVLPAVHRLPEITEPPLQLTGEMIRRRTLIPDRFAIAGIREYQDGDPVRDITWNASARTEQPMVWQYHETAFPALTVLLNMETRETDRETVSDRNVLEQEITLCAALLGEAARLRIPVRLCANTTIDGKAAESPLAAGSTALTAQLRLLAAIPETISGRFSHLAECALADDPGMAVVIVTAQPNADIVRIAAQEPRVSVLSVRRLRPGELLPNIRYISLERNELT